MTLYSVLFLAHLLYDFHWQGPFIAEMKGKSWYLLMVHAVTWALLLGVVLWLYGVLSWWQLPFLAATHFGTDAWKARYTKLPPLGEALYIDQAAHAATIAVVALVG